MATMRVVPAIFVALSMATWASTAAGQDLKVPAHNLEIVIRGDYFRAAAVAYEDFSKRLGERAVGPSTEQGDEGAKSRLYLSMIENYSFQVGKGLDYYVVQITPRMSQQQPGFFGGGATYTIDAKTFKVVERSYFK